MIRKATVSDVDSIAKVIVNTWKEAFIGIVDESYSQNLNEERYKEVFRENIAFCRETILVAGESVEGFISGINKIEKYDCEIVGFYVLPGSQGKGLGKSLFSAMVREFETLGKKSVLVWTLEGAKNNSFYEKMSGRIMERKNIRIGKKEYPGVGYVFTI